MSTWFRWNRFWLVFYVAVLVAAMFSLFLGFREDRLVERFVEGVLEPGMSETEKAVVLTNEVYELMERSKDSFAPPAGADRWLPTTIAQLMAEGGACGARSRVLARTLQVAGLDARILQMKVGDQWGAHIATVGRVDGRWVPLDALFGVAFQTPDGDLASLEEVRRNWDFFAKQLPPHADRGYDYSEFRFTNWSKVPVLLPALRAGLSATLGEAHVAELSLRARMLNVYRTVGIFLLMLVGGVALPQAVLAWQHRR